MALNALIHACETDAACLEDSAVRYTADWTGWLQPINESSLTGEDPGHHEYFLQIREEVNKLSGFDTALIATLSESLFREVCKDLRVATFYLWARLHQDGESGLADGLELLAGLLNRFGNTLHPLRARSRQAALAWLGSTRMLDSLLRWPQTDTALVRRACGALILISRALTDEECAGLIPLIKALEVRLAQNGGACAVVPQHSSDESTPEKAHTALMPVNTGQALMEQAKVLAKYLREQPEGWLAAHHLIKSVRWDTLVQLPALNDQGNTRLRPPRPDHRRQLQRLYVNKSWQELLEFADALFSQGVNHLWFDLQWYIWESLSHQPYGSTVAGIVSQDLCGLLSRLPGLDELTFDDGTPFADEVTRNWIAQSVMRQDICPEVVPLQDSSAGEEDILALETEAIQKADIDGVDAALSWLQSCPQISTVRSQWHLRLTMARLCEHYGRNELALHLLGELDLQAGQMTLQHWCPEKLFEVRSRRLRLLRIKAARSDSEKTRLQPEMDALLSGLITIDPARAAILCS